MILIKVGLGVHDLTISVCLAVYIHPTAAFLQYKQIYLFFLLVIPPPFFAVCVCAALVGGMLFL